MSRGYVIGLGSLPGAGKGQLAEQFSLLGIKPVNIGSIVYSTANANGFFPEKETREAYLPFWREYAEVHGQDWIARIAFQTAEETESRVLLEGVRIPADAHAIGQAANGTMVWLESDLPTVARRVLARGRTEDAGLLSAADYIAKAQRELADEGNFQMGAIRDLSEISLLPTPEISDLAERASYYNSLARHVLLACNLLSEII